MSLAQAAEDAARSAKAPPQGVVQGALANDVTHTQLRHASDGRSFLQRAVRVRKVFVRLASRKDAKRSSKRILQEAEKTAGGWLHSGAKSALRVCTPGVPKHQL